MHASSGNSRLFRTGLTILAVMLVFLACRRDPFVPPEKACDCRRQQAASLTGWEFQAPSVSIGRATFSRKDPRELVLTSVAHGTVYADIWRYHTSTGALTHVFPWQNGVLTGGSPYMAGSGWIVFGMAENFIPSNSNIYIMKENGDSLTQLTFDGNNFHPIWDWTGDRICYRKGAWSNPQDVGIMMSLNGTVLDTADGWAWWNNAAWTGPTTVVTDWYDGIYRSNEGHDLSRVHGWPGALSEDGIAIGLSRTGDPDVVVWSHVCGLYRTRLSTGTTERLLCTDHSLRFRGLDYDPVLNKLVSVRVKRIPIDNVTLRIETDVVLMDVDGSNVVEVPIPFPE